MLELVYLFSKLHSSVLLCAFVIMAFPGMSSFVKGLIKSCPRMPSYICARTTLRLALNREKDFLLNLAYEEKAKLRLPLIFYSQFKKEYVTYMK